MSLSLSVPSAVMQKVNWPGWENDDDDDDNATTRNNVPYLQSATAVARGRWIYGLPDAPKADTDADADTDTGNHTDADTVGTDWKWKTCLPGANGTVQQLQANPSHTVLVAVTDSGTVSLLRSVDGQVLATRTILPQQQLQQEATAAVVQVTWLPGTSSTAAATTTNDALWIRVVPQDAPTVVPDDDETQQQHQRQQQSPQDILVTNMHGAGLNNTDRNVMAQAAQAMQIHVGVSLLPTTTTTTTNTTITTASMLVVAGYAKTDSVLRLVVGSLHQQGLTVLDYSVAQQASTVVQSNIAILDNAKTNEWRLDLPAGLVLHQHPKRTLVMCCARSETATALAWFDPETLTVVCHCPIIAASKTTKVSSILPLRSCSEETIVAAAVAVKSAASPKVVVHVVQVVLEETMGLLVLSNPHTVYSVPVLSEHAVTLIPVDCGAAYSFALQNSRHAFLPPADSVIGRIRLLLAQGQFDAADELVAATGVEAFASPTEALFHPSEVALKRMEQLLAQPDKWNNAQVMEQSQQCLRRLASGAVSGGERGLLALLETVDRVRSIPVDPTLSAMITMLVAVTTTIQGVLEALSVTVVTRKLESKRQMLQDRLHAMKVIDTAATKLSLATPLRAILSPAHLFAVLCQERQFAAAEELWKSQLRALLPAEVLVSSLIQIDAQVNPSEYLGLLTEVILPTLTINHELLPSLRAWSCRMADAFDDADTSQCNLLAAIQLLEAVDRGTRDLQVKTHSSFASYTPFVERTVETRNKAKRTPRNNTNGSLDSSSGDLNISSNSSPFKGKRATTSNSPPTGNSRSNPTLLELSRLKGGATKSKRRVLVATGREEDNVYEENEDCVEEKLREAKCLDQARKLGSGRSKSTLCTFSSIGGAQFVAKELVQCFSSSAMDHDTRFEYFLHMVAPFCVTFGVSYDEALLECTLELCRGKNVSERAIQESSSIARCCSSVIIKCQATLAVLRSALLCGYSPSWLSKLSRNAISWASCDSGLQSELEEASRLLLVSGIVSKYCGSGARDLFRVDNPRHAIRLLEFVTKHVKKESVISDALSLCDAFTNLLKCTASAWLLQQALLGNDPELCTELIRKLYERDNSLALGALVKAVAYSDQVLGECSREIETSNVSGRVISCEQQAANTIRNITAFLAVALEHSRSVPRYVAAEIEFLFEEFSLERMKETFSRLEELQNHHNVFLSLSDLSSSKTLLQVTLRLLNPVLKAHVTNDSHLLNTKVTVAKRAYSLMVGHSGGSHDGIWVAACATAANGLIREGHDERVIDFMAQVGLQTKSHDDVAVRAHLSVALTLCSQASNNIDMDASEEGMKRVLRAASLLRDQSLAISPNRVLPSLVSFGSLLETVGEVFTRADEGKGEIMDAFRQELQTSVWKQRLSSDEVLSKNLLCVTPVHRPALHPTWYIGDGLLLPPTEVLVQSIDYCRKTLGGHSKVEDPAMELYRFVADRGARSLALRLLCASVIMHTNRPDSQLQSQWDSSCDDVVDGMGDTVRALAERSIGGTGTGITSGLVDSQLAASFLLSLPVKVAFHVFKSSLPTAIKTHDFTRVSTLASVGKIVSSQSHSNQEALGFCAVGWYNQNKFSEQCHRLAERAKWWIILRENGVDFDPQQFSGGEAIKLTGFDEAVGGETKYAASIIPALVAGLSRVLSTFEVVRLASSFAETFKLQGDYVIQCYIEFLLSTPTGIRDDGNARSLDVRFDLDQCERTAKALLRRLQPAMKRSAVLRRCLVTLEHSPSFDRDYERFSLVLSLYHEALIHVVDGDITASNLNAAPFQAELELIDRRRDALAILSSFFQLEKVSVRPSFTRFFPLLSKSFNHDNEADQPPPPSCGILGTGPSNGRAYFDPLRPLQEELSSSLDLGTATALAPLCLPLGLPQGYIHARVLMERFKNSAVRSMAFPSFENDVTPVFNRICLSREKVVLAEWCADHYVDNDNEKLKCLDLALHSSIQASTEVEQQRHLCSRGDENRIDDLENALGTVKRITSIKEALKDRLRVKAIIRSSDSTSQGAVTVVTEELIRLLELEVKESLEMSPERLVDFLFSTGSRLAAKASLDGGTAFSTSQFRRCAVAVHAACNEIAEEHSHIHCSQRANRFARTWLFYGDGNANLSTTTDKPSIVQPVQPTGLMDIQEEVEDTTVDFVMDMSDLQGGSDGWVGNAESRSVTGPLDKERYTSEEEPSALKEGASREISEYFSQRAALRIAFVMGFCIDDDETPEDENSSTPSNRPQANNSAKNRGGLLSRVITKRDTPQDKKVLGISRELLRIVFAKPGVSSSHICRSSSFEMNTSIMGHRSLEGPKTITFAMRHRALRAASILCPQEALEQVTREEGFLQSSAGRPQCSLRQCTFGVFVSKEIEEMGLPLPHSDLGQLSSMHFLSYARALWRHHRDGDIKGSKGRLLLLLLEMSLKDTVIDTAFLDSLLNEMTQIHLPRTLLLAVERILPFVANKKASVTLSSLTPALETAAKAILSELRRMSISEDEAEPKDILSTLLTVRRLGNVVVSLSESTEGKQQLQHLVSALDDITVASTNKILIAGLSKVQSHASRQMSLSLLPDASEKVSTEVETGV